MHTDAQTTHTNASQMFSLKFKKEKMLSLKWNLECSSVVQNLEC